MNKLPLTEHWNESFNKEVSEVLGKLLAQGFDLILVGGAVRDYILTGKFSEDLDFEIRNSSIDSVVWEESLIKNFNQLGLKYDQLSFCVFRIHLSDSSIEFATPRVEIFEEKKNNDYGHSEFKIKIDSDLDYKSAISRRDFTINSIGLKFFEDGKTQVLDPLEGIKHLEEKVLKPCGDNFYKDPVRLLRGIRFKHKFGFNLEVDSEKFNLEKLTSYYVFYESSKGNFSLFMNDLLKFKLPNWGDALKPFKKFFSLENCSTLQDFLVLISKHKNEVDKNDLADFINIFGMKKKEAIKILSE